MISGVLTEVFNIAGAVITGLGTLLTSVIELVYDNGLTDFGTLVILVAAVPLAWAFLTYVIGMFQKSAKIKGSSK